MIGSWILSPHVPGDAIAEPVVLDIHDLEQVGNGTGPAEGDRYFGGDSRYFTGRLLRHQTPALVI